MIFPPRSLVVLIQVSSENRDGAACSRLLYAYSLEPLKPIAVDGPAIAAGVCR